MKTADVNLFEWAIKDTDWVVIEDEPMKPAYRYIPKHANPVRLFIDAHKPKMLEAYKAIAKEDQTGFFLLIHQISESLEGSTISVNYVHKNEFDYVNSGISHAGVRESIAVHMEAALLYFDYPTSVPVLALSNTSLYCFLEDFSPNPNASQGFGK